MCLFASKSLDREFILQFNSHFYSKHTPARLIYQVHYFIVSLEENTPVKMILTLDKHEAPWIERK